MNKASRGILGIVMFGLLFIGCSDPVEPEPELEQELVPSFILASDEGTAPITLDVNETAVAIEVRTFGTGCMDLGETRLSVSWETRTLAVSPFDWLFSGGACPDILRTLYHSITVDLEEPGLWTVVIGQDLDHEPVQFEYSVDLGSGGLPR